MIIILEGTEGTGKTKLASRFCEEQGYVLYKCLRLNLETVPHWTEELLSEYHGYGVMVNTFAEELFTADLLLTLTKAGQAPKVVIDRSMPSALAYSSLQPGDAKAEWLWAHWARLSVENSILFELIASSEVAISRLSESDPRRFESTNIRNAKNIRTWTDRWEQEGGERVAIDTTESSPEETYQKFQSYIFGVRHRQHIDHG